MKTLCIAFAAVLLAGCSATPQHKHMVIPQGKGRAHLFAADFTNTWRAAVLAANRPPMTIRTNNPARGYIGADTPTRMESWGEGVSIWLSRTNEGTRVEVSTRHVGPTGIFRFDWAQTVLTSIAVDLGEPLPPEPKTTSAPARSPRAASR